MALPLREAQALRQRLTASCSPVPPQNAVGQLVVLEHDGSDYSMLSPGGQTNIEPRACVAQRFFSERGDFYDGLVVFTNFEFETGDTLAFHIGLRNDVQGIGLETFDFTAALGLPPRLQSYVDMAAFARWTTNPSEFRPGTPEFDRALHVLAHEWGHRFLAHVRYRDAQGQLRSDLLGREGVHWSYLLDTDASHLYGADWQRREQAGQYVADRVRESYSPLDLYLMGFLDPARVPDLTLLREPQPPRDPAGLPVEGDLISALPETLPLTAVTAAEGLRTPDFRSSQKEFRLGFVFLAAPGSQPTSAELAAVDRLRDAFEGYVFAQTGGVALVETRLAELPPPEPGGAPDLARALAWLLARQRADGSWSDSLPTAPRDTAAATRVASEAAAPGATAGLAWLDSSQPGNVDYLARRASTLTLQPLDPARRAALRAELLSHANADGGFGAALGYESDATDTALALGALRALDPLGPADTAATRAWAALQGLRNPDLGFSAVLGGSSSPTATARVLLAAHDWSELPASAPLLVSSLQWLAGHVNADGGYGEGASTAYVTALVLEALLRAAAPDTLTDPPQQWLTSHQQADGSWHGSVHATALALSALGAGTRPNLRVPQDNLVLTPAEVEEGQPVTVTARVENRGHQAAGATWIALYDGAPPGGTLVEEQAVGALASGEHADVSFAYPTLGRAGTRQLFVVADAHGEVVEAREDDNAANASLRVTGPLPDLVVTGMLLQPDPAVAGEHVLVSVAVVNSGARASSACVLRLFRGDPRQGGQLVAEGSVPALARDIPVTVDLDWNTAGQAGTHSLHAWVDATFAVEESDEANNEVATPVHVLEEPIPGVDLEVSALTLIPDRLHSLPGLIRARAHVRNLGDSPASSTLALYDSNPPTAPAAGTAPLNLAARSSADVEIEYTAEHGGTRDLVVRADPDELLTELDETNNSAAASLLDPADTIEAEILPADVVPSSTDLVVGQTLSVTVTVHNRGLLAIQQVPLVLEHVAGPDRTELARALVDVLPGYGAEAVLTWRAGFAGDPIALAVSVDPFNVLPELSEDNNEVTLSIRVRPSSLPDLAVSAADISVVPDPPLEGGAAQLAATIHNRGEVEAPASTVAFYRGDPGQGGSLIDRRDLSAVPAGASAVATVEWNPVDARGAQSLYVVADPDGVVAEYDESNNTAVHAFAVEGLPDIVLSAGDVVIAPAFPHTGQALLLSATIRNLGQQPAPASRLRVLEGTGSQTVEIAFADVPALAPGDAHAVALPWTAPASPADLRLTFVADADGAVVEQSEGNNTVSRALPVQSTDFYATVLYLSPDGDGRQDDTAIGYRFPGETVTLRITDRLGRQVRQLAEGGPSEGLVEWDGRGDQDLRLADGGYVVTASDAAGAVLGRLQLSLDTNRSPLHEVAATGYLSFERLSCSIGDASVAWLPNGEDLIFAANGLGDLAAGLYRVAAGGVPTLLFADSWYGWAGLWNAKVSPDGLAVIVDHPEGTTLVDLATGARQPLPPLAWDAQWSPDGQHLVSWNTILARDGSVVRELTDRQFGRWTWAPDGQSLANGNAIETLAGEYREIPLPEEIAFRDVIRTEWLPDGRLFTLLSNVRPEIPETEPKRVTQLPCEPHCSILIDLRSGQVERLAWLDDGHTEPVRWSPDGAWLMFERQAPDFSVTTAVARVDGSVVRELVSGTAVPLSDGSVSGIVAPPAGTAPCPSGWQRYSASSLMNLTARLQAAPLLGNAGVALRGVASDQALDHWRLEYALAGQPETWHPIGPSSEVPVRAGRLATWVPPGPGNYVVRLTVRDRAGNERAASRLVSWDHSAPILNFTQDQALISPNGDGTQDAVRFDYLVVEPAELEVVVRGPAPSGPEGPPGPPVRRLRLTYASTGPAFFAWDGRDDANQVVPDGSYTVFVDELPFRVEVDSTPPDLAFAFENVRVKDHELKADRVYRVFDANLRDWLRVPETPGMSGILPVYEPRRDQQGHVIYDTNGLPLPLLFNGQIAPLREPEDRGVPAVGSLEGLALTGRDWAGNISAAPIPLLDPALYFLGARHCIELPDVGCKYASGNPLGVGSRPIFSLAETIAGTPPQAEPILFEFREPGATWQAPFPPSPGDRIVELGTLGLDPTSTYEGRFSATRGAATYETDVFHFRLCEDLFLTSLLPGPGGLMVTVAAETAEPAATATVRFVDAITNEQLTGDLPMDRDPLGLFLYPYLDFPGRCEAAVVRIVDTAGNVFEGNRLPCQNLRVGHCAPFALEQEFEPCRTAVPDRLQLRVRESAGGFDIAVDGDPAGTAFPIARFVGVGKWDPGWRFPVDVTGRPEGDLDLLATLDSPSMHSMVPGQMVIDRTAPQFDLLSPADDSRLCLGADPEAPSELTVSLRGGDRAPVLELGAALSLGGEPWQLLSPKDCPIHDRDQERPCKLTIGALQSARFSLPPLQEGAYAARFELCDQSGNRSTVLRHMVVSRSEPVVDVVPPVRPVFSPNGDGQADVVTAQVETLQALEITARIHSAQGPTVRTLLEAAPRPPGTTLLAWDGRNQAGQVVPDGRYVLSVTVTDACGGRSDDSAELVVDTRPPDTIITEPLEGAPVVAGADVLGTASDAHLTSYTLEWGAGAAPSGWSPIQTSTLPVVAGLLGRWHAPAVPGIYTLRLSTLDEAMNSASATVTVSLGSSGRVTRLAVTPVVFSPPRGPATIELELDDQAIVDVTISTPGGQPVRTWPGQSYDAGSHQLAWDGRDDAGLLLADGLYRVWATVSGEAPVSARVIVDASKPVVHLTRPLVAEVVQRDQSVRGSIADSNPSSYVINARNAAGQATELARAPTPDGETDLATLALPEGDYTLEVLAEDAAHNAEHVELPFSLDAHAPLARLSSPDDGAVLRPDGAPVAVVGTVTDAYFADWRLAFGAGANPAAWVPLAQGDTPRQASELALWNLTGLPDGTYTLHLEAHDRSGQTSVSACTIALDGSPPEVTLDAPADGAFVTGPSAVRGRVADQQVDAWELSVAPGLPPTATLFTPLASGSQGVDGTLLEWAVLPPDGPYTLRLVARDRVGHTREARVGIHVDTTPPARPEGLRAMVTPRGTTADATLDWTANGEPDLAGYVVTFASAQHVTQASTYTETGLQEGVFPVELEARDEAGNLSPPASLSVRVDLTPPLVRILAPADGARVSGLVDVVGTAFAASDFDSYSLYAGAGDPPAHWELVRRGTLPVSSGLLGQWLPGSAGPHRLALEAQDQAGNRARVEVSLVVDTTPPDAPSLVSLTPAPAEPTTLETTWSASASADVDGYLLFRNGAVANAPGVASGDLRPYLIHALAYSDPALPDGEHCYEAAAMDLAGNLSAPSNQLCATVETRAPRAVIVEPQAGTRFDAPLRLLALSSDLDVAQVRFEVKPQSGSAWSEIGPPDTSLPFEALLDPVQLAGSGEYELRAVARDRAGHEDAAPPSVPVTFGDATPPAAPRDLSTQVDGDAVTLTWTAGPEPDLAGHHVDRDGIRLTSSPVSAPFVDTGAPVGERAYAVVAVDNDGNESRPSSAGARVYRPDLEPPPHPVTTAPSIELSGSGASAGDTVELWREGALVASQTVAGSGFSFSAAPLVPGPNWLGARVVDALGNRSLQSVNVLVLRGQVPPPPTGLGASLNAGDVTLTWTAPSTPDLFGYELARDDQDLTPAGPQTSASAIWASSASPNNPASLAFDGSPWSAWVPTSYDTQPTWYVSFDTPILVARLRLRFTDSAANPAAVASFRVSALWEGIFVPLLRARTNAEAVVEHVLPLPFATSLLQVELEQGGGGLAEVEVTRAGGLPSGTPVFTDPAVPQGRHLYRLQSVDRYGLLSEPAEADVPVGDVEAPAPPTGLLASVTGSDVQLSWSSSPEPDLARYILERDGQVVAQPATPAHVDPHLPNGEYVYRVRAIDQVGNVSAPSDPATAVVSVALPSAPVLEGALDEDGRPALSWSHPGAAAFLVLRGVDGAVPALLATTPDVRSFSDSAAPSGHPATYVLRARDWAGNESPASNAVTLTTMRRPYAPALLTPADADHPAAVSSPRVDVGGWAGAGELVVLSDDGQLVGSATATPAQETLVEQRAWPLALGPRATLSPDGRWAAFEAGTAVRLVDVVAGTSHDIELPDHGRCGWPAFDASSARLAFAALDLDAQGQPTEGGLYVRDLATGATEALVAVESGVWLSDPAWSPYGSHVAYVAHHGGGSDLRVLALATPPASTVHAVSGDLLRPAWAPDNRSVAVLASSSPAGPGDVIVVDTSTFASFVAGTQAWPGQTPSWSADVARVAYTAIGAGTQHGRIVSLAGGSLLDLAEGTSLPTFGPRPERLAYVERFQSSDGTLVDVPVSLDLSTAAARRAEPPGPAVDFMAWLGPERLAVAREGRLGVLSPFDGRFVVRQVRLHAGANALRARAVDPQNQQAGPESRPASVTVSVDGLPDLTVLASELSVYPTLPLAGSAVRVGGRVRNVGTVAVENVAVRLSVRDATGQVLHRADRYLPSLSPDGQVPVWTDWTPPAAGTFTFVVECDPDDLQVEQREDNNSASRSLAVAPAGGLLLDMAADATAYGANASARVSVTIENAAGALEAQATTAVVDSGGQVVAQVDQRQIALPYGQGTSFEVPWNTGGTWAGPYAFRLQVTAGESLLAEASAAFTILPQVAVHGRVTPRSSSVEEGAPALLELRVLNASANVPLADLLAHVEVSPAGGGASVFSVNLPLPLLVPGGDWNQVSIWPAAGPAGAYEVRLEVRRPAGVVATSTAPLEVLPGQARLAGALEIAPAHVLVGEPSVAQASVTNTGSQAIVGLPVALEVVYGPQATVELRLPYSLDLGPGQSDVRPLSLPTQGLPPGQHTLRLRAGVPERTLASRPWHLHAPLTAPGIDSPAPGSSVSDLRPTLTVLNSPHEIGLAVGYDFQLFADPALQTELPGATAVAEGFAGRTAWRVTSTLAEDQTYFWRARAGDGFSWSSWTAVGSLTVDTVNAAPSSPTPFAPLAGARVTVAGPQLTVANALDPELDLLTYEFRVATDPEMTQVVASASALPETPALTSWTVPVALQEDATYYWTARAHDGQTAAEWSEVESFVVDTENLAPSAPTLLAPGPGTRVSSLVPQLALLPASDPENDPLTHRIELDLVPGFNSPALQASPDLQSPGGQLTWAAPLPLLENSRYYWRASAHDGHARGPWALDSFFVNAVNESPSAPLLLDPAGGQAVPTPTPTLRLRNAVDPDRDSLTYDFVVRELPSGATVAGATGVAAGELETAWTVAPALVEDGHYAWQARAHDAQLAGPWSAQESFSVNAILQPPTAPALAAPPEGSVVSVPRPQHVVTNAQSPEGLPLTYRFELYRLEAGVPVLVEAAEGLPEGPGFTAWAPSADLAEGDYAWTAQARDVQPGPPMTTGHYIVSFVPSAPTSLTATGGDQRVDLSWTASTSPGVLGYRVLRASISGGPYQPLIEIPGTSYRDEPLPNGVPVYYVIRAFNAHHESTDSLEVTATPLPDSFEAEVALGQTDWPFECRLAAPCAPPFPFTAPPATQVVEPFVHCVTDNGNGSQSAFFGHTCTAPTTIPIGPDNYVKPWPGPVGLPWSFEPQTTTFPAGDFVVDFAELAVWKVLDVVATTSGAPACPWEVAPPACLEWLYATIEPPAWLDLTTIDLATVRAAGSVPADTGYSAVVDHDGDGAPELEVRFPAVQVLALLDPGVQALPVAGEALGRPIAGQASLRLATPAAGLRFLRTPIAPAERRTPIAAILAFAACLDPAAVDVSSLRLNGVVPAIDAHVLPGSRLRLRFDRAQVFASLPSPKLPKPVVLRGLWSGIEFEVHGWLEFP